MPDPIIEEFARAHPGDVARLLGNKDISELVEFLATVAPTTAARIMSRLSSLPLGAALGAMPPGQIGNLLKHSSHEDSLTLIAHLPNGRYTEIIEASEHDSDIASRLYSFAEQTLGAVAGPDFIAIRSGKLVANAREELSAKDPSDVPVYITSESGELLGRLPALVLLPGPRDSIEVDRLMVKAHPLPDGMALAASLDARQWQSASVLPVIDAENRLLGTVSRIEIERLAVDSIEPSHLSLEAIASSMTIGFFTASQDLLNLVFGHHHDEGQQ